MAVSYKKLMKLLIDKDITTKQIVDDGVLSRSTMLKIKKSEYVALKVLEDICKYLNCTLDDIIEFTEQRKED